jgi:membrane-bound ClpP family serine protease
MTLSAVLILLFLGFLLILIEILILPGTNVAGIIGLGMVLAGIYFSYKDIGTPIAHFVLAGSVVFLVGSLVLALRSKTWERLSLKKNIDGKVENVKEDAVKPGDVGIAISRLAPMGTVMINDETYEAKAGHSFVDPKTPVTVVKVSGNQIIVKPTENN